MRIYWEVDPDFGYENVGGSDNLHEIIKHIVSLIPKEHLAGMEGLYVYDTDPKGTRLGVYIRDHKGIRIELFLHPHVVPIEEFAPKNRRNAITNHLAHTFFHEVGHHVTLTLNKRAKPTKKKAEVSNTLEKWAEEYVAKRMLKLQAAQTPAISTQTSATPVAQSETTE
jgi:hypothetical protein